LVAESRSRPLSVAKRMLPRTGSVLRGATARATTLNPRAKFSCRQETFMMDESFGGVRDNLPVKYTTKSEP
jgi:hypothetical protein